MNKSTKAKWFVLSLLGGMLLTACAAVTPYAPTPTPIPTSSKTPKPVSPTFTATSLPPATLSPLDGYIQNLPSMLDGCRASTNPQSPNEEWTAYKCSKLSETLVLNKDGSKAWHLENSKFSNVDGYAVESLKLVHWSRDGQYFYFHPIFSGPCCWDPPYSFIDVPFTQVWQFELKTGRYFNILEDPELKRDRTSLTNYTIYFSPNDTIVLIIPQLQAPPNIYVYDLSEKRVTDSIKLVASSESYGAGNVVWSADGELFVVASASGGNLIPNTDPRNKPQYSIISVDLETMSQKAIISNEKGSYITLRSITNENILLFDALEVYEDGGWGPTIYKRYDLTTHQFLTPMP